MDDPKGSTRKVMSRPAPIESLSTYTITKKLLTAVQRFFKDEQIRLLKLKVPKEEKDFFYYVQPQYMLLDHHKLHERIHNFCTSNTGKKGVDWVGYLSKEANTQQRMSKLFPHFSLLLCFLISC